MKGNNLYRNLSKEKSSSIVFHLFTRHEGMASIYRQIASDLKEKHLSTWFSSLADFRQELADELRTMVEDNGEVPVTPSQEMKPYLKDHDDTIIRLINQGNAIGLIELSLEAEESVGKYYQKAEAIDDIPSEIREKLEKQHNRLVKVIRKIQRLHTVPEQSNASFFEL